jgi:hypothetical protein
MRDNLWGACASELSGADGQLHQTADRFCMYCSPQPLHMDAAGPCFVHPQAALFASLELGKLIHRWQLEPGLFGLLRCCDA